MEQLRLEYAACSECGCTDIHSLEWMHLNTGESLDQDIERFWCPQCEEELKDRDLKSVHEKQPYIEAEAV